MRVMWNASRTLELVSARLAPTAQGGVTPSSWYRVQGCFGMNHPDSSTIQVGALRTRTKPTIPLLIHVDQKLLACPPPTAVGTSGACTVPGRLTPASSESLTNTVTS